MDRYTAAAVSAYGMPEEMDEHQWQHVGNTGIITGTTTHWCNGCGALRKKVDGRPRDTTYCAVGGSWSKSKPPCRVEVG